MELLGLLEVPLWGVLLATAAVLLYIYGTWPLGAVRALGLRTPPTTFLVGHLLDLRQKSPMILSQWIKEYGNVFGLVNGRTPTMVVADLDILKHVLVKDFGHFSDRAIQLLIQNPWNRGVFFLGGSDWRRVRNIITPTFSSGKLKTMIQAINKCSEDLTTNFERCIIEGKNIDVKELYGKFTMEVIASTAFGLELDSQHNQDEPFFLYAKRIFDGKFTGNWFQRPIMLFTMAFPVVNKFLAKINFGFFPQTTSDFFNNTLRQMVDERRAGNNKRHDFLQLLLEAEYEDQANGHAEEGQRGSEKTQKRLSTDEVLGQAFLFFIAGYETTATTLQYASYLLARHPHIQQRVRQEIIDVIGQATPSNDSVAQLTYLHQVLCETLRMYPPVTRVFRKAAEDRDINGLHIPRDTAILVPIYQIHHDPRYNPDPETFDPDRFSPERQAAAHPLSWMPFGYGPRLCIGMRLALVEAKLALVHVLRKYQLTTCSETKEKLNFRDFGILTPKEPIIIGAQGLAEI